MQFPHEFISMRCNIYISRLRYDVSVRLSVCDGSAWRIIANLGFKFQSKFTAHCRRGEWLLKLNISKCNIISIGRHVDKSCMYSISQDNQIRSLERKESYKDIGVIIDEKNNL